MVKVYVVTHSQEWADSPTFSVDKVFATEEAAKAYVATKVYYPYLDKRLQCNDHNYEEFELE